MKKNVDDIYPGLLNCIRDNFSGEKAFSSIENLWKIDRWFDFAHFKQSSNFSAEKFQSAGLSQIEVISFPADGETCFGDWVVPTAWDASSAMLKLISPQILPLADYSLRPCNLAQWSAPTPPAGIEAEVILLESDPRKMTGSKMSDFSTDRLKGKILFSDLHGPVMKQIAARYGAPGIITDHDNAYGTSNPIPQPDKISWINAWSDDPNGWPLTKRDAATFGFSITASQGDELRKLLKSGQKVTAFAQVDTRLYDGSYDLVTGVIPGLNSNEEVMVFAHLYEQGAQDNCAGCAVVMEAARCLNELIASGKLSKPLRSIRFILSWEIYGLLGYSATRPEAMKRIIAGLNLDSLGVPPGLSNAQFYLHPNPHAQASYSDTLMRRIMEKQIPPGDWSTAPFDTTDSMVADPAVGIPMPWLGEMTSCLWHSNLDTPDKIDSQRLAREGAAAATYLYALANSGAKEVVWLAEEISQDILQSCKLAGVKTANPDQGKEISYIKERGLQALHSSARLDPGSESRDLISRLSKGLEAKINKLNPPTGKGEISQLNNSNSTTLTADEEKASKLIPIRKIAGGISLGRLSPDDWPAAEAVTQGQNPRWSALLSCALYWADGQRTLLEVKDHLAQEFGTINIDLFDYFYFLEKHNYIQFSSTPD